MTSALRPKTLDPLGGLRLQSTPGRDLVFKVSGDDTGGAFDYATVEVEAKNGPPLHVHYHQTETIHVLHGRFKLQIGDEESILERGGFALMPAGIPHAFLNLTEDPGELAIVFAPGGAYRFFAELGPLTHNGMPVKAEVAACFERHHMALLGPPLSAD